jgi:sugar lactone lactonase YvrE
VRTITPELSLVINAGNHLGETPLWLSKEQVLYWVNCEEPPELHRWNPATKEHRVWPMPARLGGVAPRQNGKMIIALADGIYDFDPADGALKLRIKSPLPPHAALHESGCDRQGRMWIGGFDLRRAEKGVYPKDGALHRVDGDRLITFASGITCSNGLAFSPDGRTLYHSDCLTGVVNKWDLDPVTGNISNPRDFIRNPFDQGIFDGATVDAEGGYWAAMMLAGALHRYLPDGTLDLKVQLPFQNPTKVAFGGPDLDTLYITTASANYGPRKPGAEMHGGVYSFKPGFKGLPEPLAA